MTQQQRKTFAATLVAYLQLFRIANVFTAMADVAMGFLFVQGAFAPLPVFGCLLAACSLLYTAGMVLNDVYDHEIDARDRPERPIPSGRVSLGTARGVGYGMLLCGVGLGWLSGFLGDLDGAIVWRGGAVASLLGVCVVLYDAVLKATPAGPVAMGACRFLNVLLGMSFAMPVADGWNVAGYGTHHVIVAGGIGLYVAGVTVFARTEAKESSTWRLWFGTAVMMAGIAVLGLLHRNLPADLPPRIQSDRFPDEYVWVALLCLLAFSILRRSSTAAFDPTPRQVQLAVKHAVMSIIVLDAAVALEVANWYALAVLALLIPAFALGMWISST